MTEHLPSSPALLVTSLPRTLGRTPANEAVLVGLSAAAAGHALLLGTDLDDDPVGAADLLLQTARRDAAQRVTVVVYADDAADTSSRAAKTAAAVLLRAPASGLTVLDALWVSGDRYASYLCTEPSCCPPEGSLIVTPEGDTTP